MQITIDYEASWRNSFLDGSNNEKLPKKGRKFISSLTKLKKSPNNFIKHDITIDTVMGVLNRLIGDSRKLYQARSNSAYFFKNIEPYIKFIDKPTVISNELVYLRNMNKNTDKNSFTGMLKMNEPITHSDYSSEFWGVLALSFEELCEFVNCDKPVIAKLSKDPLVMAARLEELDKLKPVTNSEIIDVTCDILKNRFEKFSGFNTKNLIKPIAIYCSALYLQLDRLSKKYDVSGASACTKPGGIKGISHNNFTKRDFMRLFTTGGPKVIWGNPYMHELFVENQGKTSQSLIKASGTLDIYLKINQKLAKEIELMIENAGVSSFYLGKKGLAYVSNLNTKEEIE